MFVVCFLKCIHLTYRDYLDLGQILNEINKIFVSKNNCIILPHYLKNQIVLYKNVKHLFIIKNRDKCNRSIMKYVNLHRKYF